MRLMPIAVSYLARASTSQIYFNFKAFIAGIEIPLRHLNMGGHTRL
jgi:hypothetical protein